jgi:hypothetical protein
MTDKGVSFHIGDNMALAGFVGNTGGDAGATEIGKHRSGRA